MQKQIHVFFVIKWGKLERKLTFIKRGIQRCSCHLFMSLADEKSLKSISWCIQINIY
jgi:hypothetical protein